MAQLILSNKQGIILRKYEVPASAIPQNAEEDPEDWSALGKYNVHKPICTPGPRPKKIWATTIV